MQVRQPMESASVTPVADTLKSRFGPEVVHGLAADLAGVAPTFDVDGFTRMALDGFEDLELTDRSRHIARALAVHLPADPIRSLSPLPPSGRGRDGFVDDARRERRIAVHRRGWVGRRLGPAVL